MFSYWQNCLLESVSFPFKAEWRLLLLDSNFSGYFHFIKDRLIKLAAVERLHLILIWQTIINFHSPWNLIEPISNYVRKHLNRKCSMKTSNSEIVKRISHSLPKRERKKTTITKTRLFKYTENFTTKKGKFSDKKFWYFSYYCSKHKLWVLVRTASARRFLRVPTIYVFEQK